MLARPHGLRPAGDHRPRAQPLLGRARLVPGGARRGPPAARSATRYHLPRRHGRRTANCRRTTGSPSSAARPGPASPSPTAPRASGTCTSSTPRQPDFDWDNPEVHEEFRGVLRFWLDRGVDGFRVDVAHGLVKAAGLPDYDGRADGSQLGRLLRRRRRARILGQPRRARHLPRLAPGPRRVRRRPLLVRRGLGRPARATGRLGAPRRDAPGLQLRLPRDRLGRGRAARRHRRVARRVRRRSAPPAPGCSPTTTSSGTPPASARRPPPPRATASAPAPAAGRGARPAPGPRRDACSCSRCPAPRTSTRARSSACPRSSTCPDEAAPGPDVPPHRRRLRPRRLPRAAAVGGRRPPPGSARARRGCRSRRALAGCARRAGCLAVVASQPVPAHAGRPGASWDSARAPSPGQRNGARTPAWRT